MLKPEDGKLAAGDALKLAGVNRDAFNSAITRGYYPQAPEVQPGRPRRFAVNDLVAAHIFGWMHERGVMPHFAAQIATDVLRHIQKTPTVPELSAWKCLKHDGSPYVVVHPVKPQKTAIELYKFSIADIRQRMVDGIEAKMRDGSY